MDAIVAVYSDWGIGAKGTQPIVLKADRAHFKEVTEGRTVIVGRKTLNDLPNGKPLKNRRNIVVTRKDIVIDGAEIAHTPEEARLLCEDGIVIGGASIYRDFMPMLDRVYVTKIDICPESDSYFLNLDDAPDWECVCCSDELSENGTGYRFLIYERK